jgi:transcriptional regulator with XRE-family HTH domain
MLPQDIVRAAMKRHDMSAEDVCKITGVSPASLSRFMAGNKNLPGLVELLRTLYDLDKIAADSPPYAVPVHDATAVRKMIEDYRNGTRYIPVAVGGQESLPDFEAKATEATEIK